MRPGRPRSRPALLADLEGGQVRLLHIRPRFFVKKHAIHLPLFALERCSAAVISRRSWRTSRAAKLASCAPGLASASSKYFPLRVSIWLLTTPRSSAQRLSRATLSAVVPLSRRPHPAQSASSSSIQSSSCSSCAREANKPTPVSPCNPPCNAQTTTRKLFVILIGQSTDLVRDVW